MSETKHYEANGKSLSKLRNGNLILVEGKTALVIDGNAATELWAVWDLFLKRYTVESALDLLLDSYRSQMEEA